MSVKNRPSREQWLHQALVTLWIVVILGYAINAAALLFWPKVESVSPDLAINSSLGDSAVVAQQAALSGRAFVDRPLFLPGRRSRAALDSNLAIPQEAEAVGAGALEGIELVGLFSSETELGVILLDETRSSIRLRRGQAFKGWTLVEVDPHAAFFESASGGRMKMGLAAPLDSQKTSGVSVPKRGNGAPNPNLSASVGAADTSSKSPGVSPLTLESMYQRKAAVRRSASGTEESQK